MIIDLERFVTQERPYWTRLEGVLKRLEEESRPRFSIDELKEFHYLYERAAAGLGKVTTFASEPLLREYLETLVARGYGEIHESRDKAHRLAPLKWITRILPQTFRRRIRAFWMAIGITALGCVFGGGALLLDPPSKSVIMPFSHLVGDPSDRVAMEENRDADRMAGGKATFSAYLMTHNIKVSIMAFALGLSWGVGTVVLLFYNGIILGAVAVDYIAAGEIKFLFGWLLPHGAVEIPAILIAGQSGLVLAGALIGWGKRQTLRSRLREVGPDTCTLIAGASLMLVWAGFVESYLSQYHEPIVPYEYKIAFGCVQLVLLALYYGGSGRSRPDSDHELA